MITRLKRREGKGTAQWTRHAVRYAKGYSGICGTSFHCDAVDDLPAVQGVIHNCKRCMRLTDERLWEGLRVSPKTLVIEVD